MAQLGDLERSIMSVLWDTGEPLSANDLCLRMNEDLAVTTVLTVLSRLEKKDLVHRDRSNRPHRYEPLSSREEHTASLLHEVLGTADNRQAVLAQFLGGVSDAEAQALKDLLSR